MVSSDPDVGLDDKRELQEWAPYLDGVEKEARADSTRWVIWYLRSLLQAFEVYSKTLEKRYQVSQPQLSCLLVLHEYGSLPSSKIARNILVKPSTVTGIIDRLEQKGLVQRLRSDTDRRVVNIELTERGQELAASAPPPIPKTIIDGLDSLSSDEIAEIVKALSKLVEMLKPE